MIQNPILPGFNPDPSIIRVGDDYYLVTSSFEWFPGVPLYHSRDLSHWELVDYLLKSREFVDLTGIKPSRGVWAPGLSYCAEERRFYLMFSNVHNQNQSMFDVDNYMIWTDDIRGEWNKPIYLNSSGFDPSLFHDDDGRKWVINKDRDFRPANIDHRAIVIQELEFKSKKLIGSPITISRGGTRRRFVEGAHIFKRDGWYYLITAEGGTGYGHSVVLSRSRSVTGPYESSPCNPIITSTAEDFTGTEKSAFMMPERYNPDAELQKAGHGSLVETQSGEWYMAHLCGRPVMPQKRCILGRETSLQKMVWTDDGWLRMADGSNIAKSSTPEPALPSWPYEPDNPLCDFNSPTLDLHFCTPRNEITPEWADLSTHKGFLRLRGRESLSSNYFVSLLARRITAFRACATTLLYFNPEHYHHLAGITCYYDSESHYCAYKTYDEVHKREILSAYAFIGGKTRDLRVSIPVPSDIPVYLRAEINLDKLNFCYSLNGATYLPIGPELDMTALSDEASTCGKFTGSFVGMFAQDTHTKSKWAEFDWFRYETDI
jgi:xylan 1,4-beta-xylosidase